MVEKPLEGPGDPRVYFAAERTHLSWIRTGLALMGFGFVVARFGLFLREVAAGQHLPPARHGGLSMWMGTALVLLGVGVNIIASAQHSRFVKGFARGELPRLPRWPMGIVVSTMLAAIGGAMAVYLIFVR
ncbi:MAG: hypothetical protein JWM97_3031 [Phycisphaerales bacterium]|jgi:putative membrane protein|nr:hypothetical protein [Phycisphaerales bacterium]